MALTRALFKGSTPDTAVAIVVVVVIIGAGGGALSIDVVPLLAVPAARTAVSCQGCKVWRRRRGRELLRIVDGCGHDGWRRICLKLTNGNLAKGRRSLLDGW